MYDEYNLILLNKPKGGIWAKVASQSRSTMNGDNVRYVHDALRRLTNEQRLELPMLKDMIAQLANVANFSPERVDADRDIAEAGAIHFKHKEDAELPWKYVGQLSVRWCSVTMRQEYTLVIYKSRGLSKHSGVAAELLRQLEWFAVYMQLVLVLEDVDFVPAAPYNLPPMGETLAIKNFPGAFNSPNLPNLAQLAQTADSDRMFRERGYVEDTGPEGERQFHFVPDTIANKPDFIERYKTPRRTVADLRIRRYGPV